MARIIKIALRRIYYGVEYNNHFAKKDYCMDDVIKRTKVVIAVLILSQECVGLFAVYLPFETGSGKRAV
jgi:hypothetical protein